MVVSTSTRQYTTHTLFIILLGDGCDEFCRIEMGYSCIPVGVGSSQDVCNVGCGDGVRQSWEQCDDGGNVAGDGCSPSCIIEPGSTCTPQPGGGVDVCQQCGNRKLEGTESCDDGNTVSGF